ncbi:DUF885 domain-containing protein [Catenuloplanes indicus]|uniref:Uncharacterized protein (DUF885 family) n=1 Tax=Catenuloplanes indicus TaxID=137267 RepID=A0AAE4B0N7_9ACTN|nr:DUF885 domain-containing protein [Catenuloplanes indicus]MDQ0367023.1 uncharacterized protein (DUF885 family) [Catenuloplanes indicus]
MSDFVPVAERIVDAILASEPVTAFYAGDHTHDDRLPDHSAGAVTERTAMLIDAGNALAQLDVDGLDPEDQVDHAILTTMVERRLLELTEIREHEWNPLLHNPGPLLHGLMARRFAPVAARLESLAGRLAAVPDAVATARAVLHDCPRVHVETAAGQFAGAAGLIRDELPTLLAEEPSLAGRITPLAARAAEELDGFAAHLRGLDADGRSPRLGRRQWEARLWHTLDTELSASEVLRRAEDNLERIGERIRETAAELTGGPATDETVRRALAQLAEERPDNDTIVDFARVTMAETTDFVRTHGIVTIPDDECVIEAMPEFARGVSVAYCDPPGPMETADVPTFYCIAPAPADWSPERVESLYREYNHHMVRNLTVHEAMPGHFVQLAHARRYRGNTRVRSLGWSDPFVEGWAVHAEESLADHGFGGLPVRMQQLKMQLRMTMNAVLDQLVHCEDLSETDAMRMMTGRAFQEEGEAAGKWRRLLLTSTQLSTYFVGYTEVSAIAAARPPSVPLGTWHDAMLAHGSPSPRHLRTLLGV